MSETLYNDYQELQTLVNNLHFMAPVSCPYCDREIRHRFNIEAHGNGYIQQYSYSQVVYCEGDDGGCDKEFVAQIGLYSEPKTRKIEGQESE